MISTKSTARLPFAALRELARKEPQVEHCELCGVTVAEEHTHLIEPVNWRLVCCCDACAILFSSGQSPKYRLVPRQVRYWAHFHMIDVQWDDLHIPINLAFFLRSTPANRVLAMYPSPAGPMESLLTLESWSDLVADNPQLGRLEPSALGKPNGRSPRVLCSADRRLLQACRPDPRPLARPFRRRRGMGNNRSVLQRLEGKVRVRERRRPCLS